jgi:putative phosphoesterase
MHHSVSTKGRPPAQGGLREPPMWKEPGGKGAEGGPLKKPDRVLLGVISDTHGLLRPQALKALGGVDHIIHAGDIGSPEILTQLEGIAPVTAVSGNMDWGGWTTKLRETEVVEVGGVSIYVLHDLDQLDLNPGAAGFDAVVSGHTHLPEIRRVDGVLFLNPGSAGPVRGSKPVAVAVVEVAGGALTPRIVTLL